jgi:hypothetical protein
MCAEELPMAEGNLSDLESRLARLRAAEDSLMELIFGDLLQIARLRAHELDADSA